MYFKIEIKYPFDLFFFLLNKPKPFGVHDNYLVTPYLFLCLSIIIGLNIQEVLSSPYVNTPTFPTPKGDILLKQQLIKLHES